MGRVYCSRCQKVIHDTQSALREPCEECRLNAVEASLDGTEEELKAANKRRLLLEKYIMLHPNQAGHEYCEWLELRDRIALLVDRNASLTFKRDWEFQQDLFAVERSE